MEEEHDQCTTPPCEAGPSTSPSSQLHEEPETSTTELHAQLQQPDRYTANQPHRQFLQQESSLFDLSSAIDVAPSGMRDNVVWPCVAILVTLWLLVSITVILGLYGSWTLQLGPNCSRLITANPLFVHSIQAQQTEGIPGPVLYGLHISPILDVKTTWTETHKCIMQPNFHKEWIYYLNTGSKLDISYYVKNPSSSPLILAIAQGEASLINWIDDPSNPNSTLSWNLIYGSGRIEQEITTSSNYYIAVGNLNSDTNLEVELNFTIKALLYNISQAYIRCSLYNRVCSFSLMFLSSNALVLTSPGPEQANEDEDWYIKLSYGLRWLSCILVSGVLAVTVVLIFKFCNLLQQSHVDGGRTADRDHEEPLLSPKDDGHSSWGSSYGSASDEDSEERVLEEGKEEENKFNPLKFCVVCFDSPRDCFFLPCGHCAACFTCGSRIVEEAGICPVCRRRMKKARKIFSV